MCDYCKLSQYKLTSQTSEPQYNSQKNEFIDTWLNTDVKYYQNSTLNPVQVILIRIATWIGMEDQGGNMNWHVGIGVCHHRS